MAKKQPIANGFVLFDVLYEDRAGSRADPGRGSGGAAGYALGRSEPQDDL